MKFITLEPLSKTNTLDEQLRELTGEGFNCNWKTAFIVNDGVVKSSFYNFMVNTFATLNDEDQSSSLSYHASKTYLLDEIINVIIDGRSFPMSFGEFQKEFL